MKINFLHCNDNESEDVRQNSERHDPLHRFLLLLNGLNDACKQYWGGGGGAKIWNALPRDMKNELSFETFRNKLKSLDLSIDI